MATGRDASTLLRTVVAGGYWVGCGACAVVEGSPLRMERSEDGRFVAVPAGPLEAPQAAREAPQAAERRASRRKPPSRRRWVRKLRRRVDRVLGRPRSLRRARDRPDWRILKGHKHLCVMQPTWSNLGDQALSIATEAWLARHYRDAPVVPLDFNETAQLLPALARLATPDDIVFIQAGGNLGDHWLGQEKLRRQVIQAFPRNRVVVLPNSIFFGDTPEGRRERAITRAIYAGHPALTVMTRDPVSYRQALALFPRAQVLCTPDFALTLAHPEPEQAQPGRSGALRTLLLLRDDHESTLSASDEERLQAGLPGTVTRLDTFVSSPVDRGNRAETLRAFLDLYQAHDLVVTNRLHGAIFSALCRRPCVVLPTVDHKVTCVAYWMRDVPFVRVGSAPESVDREIAAVLSVESRAVPDYGSLYFDRLPDFVATGRTGAPFDGAGWEGDAGEGAG